MNPSSKVIHVHESSQKCESNWQTLFPQVCIHAEGLMPLAHTGSWCARCSCKWGCGPEPLLMHSEAAWSHAKSPAISYLQEIKHSGVIFAESKMDELLIFLSLSAPSVSFPLPGISMRPLPAWNMAVCVTVSLPLLSTDYSGQGNSSCFG